MTKRIETVGTTYPGSLYSEAPRNVYWETTIACDLACQHCRANAIPHRDPAELTTDEGKALMRSVKEMGSMLILTGGDPLKRPDIFELIAYGQQLPIHVAITPSTTPTLDRETVGRFRDLGVAAMGVSLDGPTADIHDAFRNVPGTFDYSMRALEWARELDIAVQVNTTVTAATLPHVPAMYTLLRDTASPPVRRWSLFLLVPVGRGEELGIPTADQVEELFEWVYSVAPHAPFRIGTTEAPHYRRYWIQRKLEEGATLEFIESRGRAMAFGIRDGNGVVFVSHRGEVYPAGFLPYPLLGNVKESSLAEIYRDSPELERLRDPANYQGRCGRCEFKWACGGSRARAYAMTGDPLGEDPLCGYEPNAADGS
jgi:radical SAM protein